MRAKRIVLQVVEYLVLGVNCPYCNAVAGESCFDMRKTGMATRHIRNSHEQRFREYRKLRGTAVGTR